MAADFENIKSAVIMESEDKRNMKNRLIHFIIVLSFVLSACAALLIFKHQSQLQYMEIVNGTERSMYIAFEKIDDIFRETENIVANNREIMTRDFDAVEKSALSGVVKDMERIKLSASYVDELVLYKKEGNLLITSTGTAQKDAFLKYSYLIDDEMLERFERVSDSYLASTVMALNPDGGDEYEGKGTFVVPKKSDMYGVMILAFVNEKQLMDFCGIANENKIRRAVLLDEEYNVVISSASERSFGKKAAMQRLKTGSKDMRGGLISPFSYTKWFDYGNMIYHIEINNRLSGGYISGILLMVLCAAVFIVYYSKKCYKLTKQIDENSQVKHLDTKTALYCALTMKGFASDNKAVLGSLLSDNEGNKRYCLILLLFTDVHNRKMVPGADELCLCAKEHNVNMKLVGDGRNRYCGIILMPSLEEGNVDEALWDIIGRTSGFADTVIVKGECFTDIEQLRDVYNGLKSNLGNLKITEKNCIVQSGECRENDSFFVKENIRPSLVKLAENGNAKDMTEFFTGIINEAFDNEVTFDNYIMLIKNLYMNFMTVTDISGIDERETQQLREMFSVSLEEFAQNLDVHGITSAFLNLVVMITTKKKNKKKDRMDERILKYINQNYKGDLYLDKVAQEFGFTSKYLSSYFKRKFNVGFNEYVTALRIDEAKRLLTETDEGILSICKAVGYTNNATFNMAFKKITGVSPSSYREENKTQQ